MHFLKVKTRIFKSKMPIFNVKMPIFIKSPALTDFQDKIGGGSVKIPILS